jgi:hypothetical protein
MPQFLDRGHLVVRDESDGTQTLIICDSVVDGQAVDISAEYRHVPKVLMADSVRLTSLGGSRFTDRVVEVDGRHSDAVRVRAVS